MARAMKAENCHTVILLILAVRRLLDVAIDNRVRQSDAINILVRPVARLLCPARCYIPR